MTGIFAKAAGLEGAKADRAAEAAKELFASLQPIPRAGATEDIARAAVYLASDGASFVNGHALVVDGGLTLGAADEARAAIFMPIFAALGVDSETIAAIFKPAR